MQRPLGRESKVRLDIPTIDSKVLEAPIQQVLTGSSCVSFHSMSPSGERWNARAKATPLWKLPEVLGCKVVAKTKLPRSW
eukprot:5331374-Amphidinium_carterae.1